jgi:hypothetical protein
MMTERWYQKEILPQHQSFLRTAFYYRPASRHDASASVMPRITNLFLGFGQDDFPSCMLCFSKSFGLAFYQP